MLKAVAGFCRRCYLNYSHQLLLHNAPSIFTSPKISSRIGDVLVLVTRDFVPKVRARIFFDMDVDYKLLRAMSFPPEFKQKVDMRKVNIEVMKKYERLSMTR